MTKHEAAEIVREVVMARKTYENIVRNAFSEYYFHIELPLSDLYDAACECDEDDCPEWLDELASMQDKAGFTDEHVIDLVNAAPLERWLEKYGK